MALAGHHAELLPDMIEVDIPDNDKDVLSIIITVIYITQFPLIIIYVIWSHNMDILLHILALGYICHY